MNYRTRMKYLAKAITLIIMLLTIIPNRKWKIRLNKKLKKWHNKIYPNLFDDEDFLYYVKKKKEGFIMNIDSIQTLVMRGSNSDYGFYSPLWKNSYNLGLTSSDLYFTFIIYKRYRKQLKRLKNIIIYHSVSSSGYSLIHTSERYRAVAYKCFFNTPYLKREMINSKYEKLIFKKCYKLKPINISPDYRGYDKKTCFGINISAEERIKPHLRENKRKPNQMHWLKKTWRFNTI